MGIPRLILTRNEKNRNMYHALQKPMMIEKNNRNKLLPNRTTKRDKSYERQSVIVSRLK